ncbi:MAG: T9SS type A sorting domain-containing protein [Bacteroidia bacterium]|jgi:hypothetical protein|nr:T9SS type A sorting domain-containing protein [Bacteroidia bacterium]
MKNTLPVLVMCFISIGTFAQNCPHPSASIDLDVNNVRAKILNGGDLWWDPISTINTYEVPIGSSKNAIFCGSIWIGGYDASNQLLMAAQTYRQGGKNDFWAGPISVDTGSGATSITPATCNFYDNLYPMTKAEVNTFVNFGIASSGIINWPGNGNVSAGQLPYLAPFFDANNDGIYNHTSGDYPYFNLSGNYPVNQTTGLTECNDYLFGDKSIWWVFNDIGNIKTETNSGPIGLEIRAQAFAYSSTNPAINNTTFYKYQIINRSSGSLFQTHLGAWVDVDLGNFTDDYVGCDVGRDLGYVYNGDLDDNGTGGYGVNPPACGLDFLQGPLADSNDGIDNNHNGFTDELGEDCLMSSFMYYNNVNNSPTGNPANTLDYYNYLKSIWIDGTPVTYGGNGKGSGPGATTTPTTFMYPNNTNPLFPTPWTMGNSGIQANDMRFIVSSGPFTMQPGEVCYMTNAVVWARTSVSGNPLPSVTELQAASDVVQLFFDSCFKFSAISGIEKQDKISGVKISPNPFKTNCTIHLEQTNLKSAEISLHTLTGKLISLSKYNQVPDVINLGDDLKAGVYIISIQEGNRIYAEKIIKLE